MAEVDLEAEQVVGEEAEAAPKKAGSALPRKGVIIVGSIVLIEGLLLFGLFEGLRGDGAGGNEAAAISEEAAGAGQFESAIENVRRLELGNISIYDESDPRKQAPRRYTMSGIKVYLAKKKYEEIELLLAENPDAFEFVSDAVRDAIQSFLLENGGEVLRTKEMQKDLPEKLAKHIGELLPPLKAHIIKVTYSDFRPSKW